MEEKKEKKKKDPLFIIGLILVVCGAAVLAFFAYNKISRELYKKKLMRECPIFELPELDIKAPILEGTSNENLQFAAGHFPDTGGFGTGNYCICGHNSTIYACIFNDLPKAEKGMKMYLYDNDDARTKYTYTVTEKFLVEPSETWILKDFGDDRITVITCNDSGEKRHVIVGSLDK